MFLYRVDVRFRDCDPMGHVNNAVYFTYLEQARFAWWHALKTAGTAVFSEQAGIILAHAACDFRVPAKYGDTLEVRVRVARVGRSSFSYAYEVADATSGRIVATASTVQVTYDYTQGQAVPIPDALRTWLEREHAGDPAPAAGSSMARGQGA